MDADGDIGMVTLSALRVIIGDDELKNQDWPMFDGYQGTEVLCYS